QLACAVSGPDAQVIRPFRARCPVCLPDHPGQRRQRRLESGRAPAAAAVGAVLHTGDAARAGERYTGQRHRSDLDDVAIAWYVEARGGLHDRVVIPTLLLQIPPALVVDDGSELDLFVPLPALMPGDADA